MQQFIGKHQDQIAGVLSGFDRLVLRGTLRSIAYGQGMSQYLWASQVLLKNFGVHVEQVSERLKAASLAEVVAAGRPVRYLTSSTVSKEKLARRIAAQDGITGGPVCVLTCVEPCRSFQIYRNRDTQHLELQPRDRKCLFLYHYSVHPVFGFLNARIQTWFPFSIQICLNGREWLAHQMDAVGLDYLRDDNCFPWIEDWPTAQQLMDQQLTVKWPALLDDIARTLNPIHDEIFEARPTHYYWSTYQSEWAIDISFRTPDQLRRLYPRLLQHAITTFGSSDVMRFLARHMPLNGAVPKGFTGEVVRWSPRGATGTIESKLTLAGYRRVARSERFIVAGAYGPLREGELERARRWGAALACALNARAFPPRIVPFGEEPDSPQPGAKGLSAQVLHYDWRSDARSGR